MEDQGKHRFHSLEHDWKIRLVETQSRTSTLRGYEAPGKMQKQTTETKTEDGKRTTERPVVIVESTDARAIAFLTLTRGIGTKEAERNTQTLGSKAG